MARKKTEVKKEGLVIHSLALTRADAETLGQLSGDATDYIGRKVSGSAVMRALLRYAGEQGYEWVLATLCPRIEKEMAGGVMWGKKK